MAKQIYKIGDEIKLKRNPFDEQIPEEWSKYLSQKGKVQKIIDIQKVEHGQWLKTDWNDSWIDSGWFALADRNVLRFESTKLKLSQRECKDTTLYFFDIWELEISESIFNNIDKNKVFIFDNKKDKSMTDTCSYFLQEIESEDLPVILPSSLRISMAALVKITYKDKVLFLKEDDVIKPFGGAYNTNSV